MNENLIYQNDDSNIKMNEKLYKEAVVLFS